MATMNEMFPSNYIKGADIKGDTVVTVDRVSREEVGPTKDQKWVIHFKELEKGLTLNKTNGQSIEVLYGPDTEGWRGRQITLFSTMVDFQGKQVLSVRIRQAKPAQATQPAPWQQSTDPDDDIPY